MVHSFLHYNRCFGDNEVLMFKRSSNPQVFNIVPVLLQNTHQVFIGLLSQISNGEYIVLILSLEDVRDIADPCPGQGIKDPVGKGKIYNMRISRLRLCLFSGGNCTVPLCRMIHRQVFQVFGRAVFISPVSAIGQTGFQNTFLNDFIDFLISL